MGKPLKYTKVKVIKITQTQHNTLKKLDSYKVNVSDFIRTAIQEKIKRDYHELIPKQKTSECPF